MYPSLRLLVTNTENITKHQKLPKISKNSINRYFYPKKKKPNTTFRILGIFLDFVQILRIFKKVTIVTTNSYWGYYWTPKVTKNKQKPHEMLFFGPKGKNPRPFFYFLDFFRFVGYFI